MRIKEVMCEIFEAEFYAAQQECDRLSALFKDVCWYNFETKCKFWQRPWPQSYTHSAIELYGVRIEIDDSRGRKREVGHFPLYYSGTVDDAPSLPPDIILLELKAASDYLEVCRKQCSAPHDWAPGGSEYNKLLRTTMLPTKLDKKRERSEKAAASISKRIATDKHDNNRGDAGQSESRRNGR
jgi:hypothetical protein